jgi:hypothetical protein
MADLKKIIVSHQAIMRPGIDITYRYLKACFDDQLQLTHYQDEFGYRVPIEKLTDNVNYTGLHKVLFKTREAAINFIMDKVNEKFDKSKYYERLRLSRLSKTTRLPRYHSEKPYAYYTYKSKSMAY